MTQRLSSPVTTNTACCTCNGNNIHGSEGFSIISIIITLAFTAIIITWAVPSFREIQLSSYATGTVNEFSAHVALARSTAIARDVQTQIRSVDDKWQQGWEIAVDSNNDRSFSDDEVVQRREPIKYGFTMQPSNSGESNTKFITFSNNNARVIWPPNRDSIIFLCWPEKNKSKSYTLTVTQSGNVQLNKPGNEC